MKPIYEQEWAYRKLSGDVIGEDGHSLTADGVGDDALRLISAATDMARLLLLIRNTLVEEGASGKAIEHMDTVLRKAGVLP